MGCVHHSDGCKYTSWASGDNTGSGRAGSWPASEPRPSPFCPSTLAIVTGISLLCIKPDPARYRNGGYSPYTNFLTGPLNNLAALLYTNGKVDEAEQLYRRAVAIKERNLGPHHPDVAVTAQNLAVLYAHSGRTQQAKALYRRALTIFRATLPPGHPTIALCATNLKRCANEEPIKEP